MGGYCDGTNWIGVCALSLLVRGMGLVVVRDLRGARACDSSVGASDWLRASVGLGWKQRRLVW